MTVAVEIANDALNYLGAEGINDFSDDNNIARTCRRQYPIARDYILRQHPWNFAVTRERITSSGLADTFSDFGEAYAFTVPTNSVRIYKVVNDCWKPLRYKLERGIIYALPQIKSDILIDPAPPNPFINLIYIDNTVDENLFDATFKKAVATQMAADMCYKITQSTTLQGGLIQLAKDFVGEARSIDSQVGEPQDMQFDYFDKARRSNHEIYPDSDFF